MSNEIATTDQVNALIAGSQGKYVNDKAMAKVTKAGDWLPYVQIMGSQSKEVQKGEFPMGHFCLNKNKQKIDLGEEVVMYLIAWRPKAMQFIPEVVNVFDPESEDFQRIEKRADTVKQSGCGYGPEFLVWLPEHGELATYFLGNPTGRNESPNLITLINDGTRKCKQKSELIDDGKNTWHGPKTKAHDLDVMLPPMDVLQSELEKFNNPKATEVAEKDEDDGERG